MAGIGPIVSQEHLECSPLIYIIYEVQYTVEVGIS